MVEKEMRATDGDFDPELSIWQARLVEIKALLDSSQSLEDTDPGYYYNLKTLEINVRATANRLNTHSKYMSEGGRDKYFAKLTDMYRVYFPDPDSHE